MLAIEGADLTPVAPGDFHKALLPGDLNAEQSYCKLSSRCELLFSKTTVALELGANDIVLPRRWRLRRASRPAACAPHR